MERVPGLPTATVTDITVTETCLLTSLGEAFEDGNFYRKTEKGIIFSAPSNQIFLHKSGQHWKFPIRSNPEPFWVVIPKDSVELKTYLPKELDFDEKNVEELIPGYTEFLDGLAEAMENGESLFEKRSSSD